MSTEGMSTGESARRLAVVLSNVMNVTAILHNEPALETSDRIALRSALLQIVEEMTWLATVVARGLIGGILWPPDAQERIENLRAVADAWEALDPPPPQVLDAARHCFRILQPT